MTGWFLIVSPVSIIWITRKLRLHNTGFLQTRILKREKHLSIISTRRSTAASDGLREAFVGCSQNGRTFQAFSCVSSQERIKRLKFTVFFSPIGLVWSMMKNVPRTKLKHNKIWSSRSQKAQGNFPRHQFISK